MVRCRRRQDLAVDFEEHSVCGLSDGRSVSPASPRLGSHIRSWRGPLARLGVLALLLVVPALPDLVFAQASSPDAQAPASQPAQAPASQAGQAPAATQSSSTSATPANAPQTGFTGFVQTQDSANLVGTALMFDADLGYVLSDHISADVGVPVVFTRSPFSPVRNHDYYWLALLGEPYVDVKYTGVYHNVNYTSVLTGTAPVANEDKIYSTGRFGGDLFNHVDEQIGSVTPFVNVELSNGAVNRFIMPRPFEEARMYQSLGLLGDAEVGVEYKINTRFVRGVNVGASAYGQTGFGSQKMYSRLVFPYSSLAGDGHHYRYWDSSFETKGTSAITHDNGWSVWVDTKPVSNLNVQLAYTRSVHFHMDVYSAVFTFDASQWVKALFRRR
jgi:hypothetical protein